MVEGVHKEDKKEISEVVQVEVIVIQVEVRRV